MGSGKSTVLAEASDILALQSVVHAAIDLDSLGLAHLPSTASNNVAMYRNLHSVCENYGSLGVTQFLLARAIEDRAELELCRRAAQVQDVVVCRITASVETMQQRVRRRESGLLQGEFVARVATLNAILNAARLEDFTVANENRSVKEVANEMLRRAGWVLGSQFIKR